MPCCRKVYVWHMHSYSRLNDLSALSSFNEAVASRFDGEARVRVNKVAEKPFGPHPCISIRDRFALLYPAVQMHNGKSFEVATGGGMTTDD